MAMNCIRIEPHTDVSSKIFPTSEPADVASGRARASILRAHKRIEIHSKAGPAEQMRTRG